MEKFAYKKQLEKCREDRRNTRESHFLYCTLEYGKDVARELESFYELYDEKNYFWLSDLWEPAIGGFYFSDSARKTEGFLPDVESTMQALRYMSASGLNSSRASENTQEAVGAEMRSKLVTFTKNLQDSEDGYFYHPQWGKRISTSRRGRDLGWSTALLRDFSDTPLYKTPLDKTDKGEKSPALPEHLSSLRYFKEYLEGLDLHSHSYWNGSLLQSQQRQIKAAGEEFVDLLFSHLESKQRKDNGLWEPQVNYASANGLMKINLMYTFFERPLPFAELALNNALKVALSDEPIVYCTQFYNPLITMEEILKNIKKFGEEKRANLLRGIIKSKARELLSTTHKKAMLCKRDDGAFSYFCSKGCEASQGAPVSLGVLESDINATYLSSVGVSDYLCSIFEIPKIPIFGVEDSRLFYKLLENSKSIPKIHPKPEWFESKLT